MITSLDGPAHVREADRARWCIDTSASTLGFTISHFAVSAVRGRFREYSGQVLLDEATIERSQAEFTAEVASIDTGNQKRDQHLRAADIFDVERFPQLSFRSTRVSKAGKLGGRYAVTGELAMHGVTKEVSLEAVLGAPTDTRQGDSTRFATVKGKVKRSDFKIELNSLLGRIAVGDEVNLEVSVLLRRSPR